MPHRSDWAKQGYIGSHCCGQNIYIPPSVSRHRNLSEKRQEGKNVIFFPIPFYSNITHSQVSSSDIKAINSQVSLFNMTNHVVIQQWCKHYSGVIQWPWCNAKYLTWRQKGKLWLTFKCNVSDMISTSAYGAQTSHCSIFLSYSSHEWGCWPPSCPLIYSTMAVKWQTRITWVVINDYKTTTSSC